MINLLILSFLLFNQADSLNKIEKFSKGKDFVTGTPIKPFIEDYGEVRIVTGFGDKGSNIGIYYKNQEKLYIEGGDGYFERIDTTDFNKDGMIDFVFKYGYGEINWSLGVLISTKDKNYKSIHLGEVIRFEDLVCHVKGFKVVDDSKIEDFVLLDFNKDGLKEVVTNVYNYGGKYFKSSCSKIFNINKLK